MRLFDRGLTIAALVCGLICGAGALSASAADIYSPKGVVELFTSQGCSSCPPADEYVHELRQSGEVLALAWHVDYWDYLGWKDTFAKPAYADRQRRYALSFGERQIYTPQAVINGRSHTVGSHKTTIRERVEGYMASGLGLTVPVMAYVDSDALQVKVAAIDEAADATLWMVYFNNQEQVQVERGENRGRSLTYGNIVREVEMVGMVKQDGLTLHLPFSEITRRGFDSCALVLQKTTALGTPGPIVGATVIRNVGG